MGEHLTQTEGFLCPGRCAAGGLLMPPLVYIYTVLTMSGEVFPSAVRCCDWYWPAGVSRRLPSGVKVSLRKKEVSVSFA